jgi:hypothetical protein
MPIVKGRELTPEQAILQGRSPETGELLEDLDILAHIETLWPRDRPPEAQRRIDLLMGYKKEREAAAAAAATTKPAA